MNWVQSILVTGLPDQPYVLHCEPEGAEQQIEPGDEVTITFSAERSHGFEITWVSDGILLTRLGDSMVEIDDKRGRNLRW